jgi:hypothetical protein
MTSATRPWRESCFGFGWGGCLGRSPCLSVAAARAPLLHRACSPLARALNKTPSAPTPPPPRFNNFLPAPVRVLTAMPTNISGVKIPDDLGLRIADTQTFA